MRVLSRSRAKLSVHTLSLMKNRMKSVFLLLVLAQLASAAFARLGWYPDFDELAKKSDVIVIAEDTAVRDLAETRDT